MKITKAKLKQLIREELQKVMTEAHPLGDDPGGQNYEAWLDTLTPDQRAIADKAYNAALDKAGWDETPGVEHATLGIEAGRKALGNLD